ncbi:MAG: hypothetical protein K1X75_11385 [Leptospirales bacterium]|nr:hypothetical protein [Leptospirales bacterium]
MSDRIRNIRARMLGNASPGGAESGDHAAAAAAYIPLVGWAYAYFSKKEDDYCQFHARQGLKLNAVIGLIYFAVWFLETFPITAWFFGPDSLLHPITRTILYVSVAGFLAASAAAAAKAFQGERWEIPYLEDLIAQGRQRLRELFDREEKK